MRFSALAILDGTCPRVSPGRTPRPWPIVSRSASMCARCLPPPKAVAEVRSGLTVMPGGSVLTGGPEERLPAQPFTVFFEGEPIDLRLFIVPGEPRPWDLPEFNEEQRTRVMIMNLKARFESWIQDRGGGRNNRIDRELRKRFGRYL